MGDGGVEEVGEGGLASSESGRVCPVIAKSGSATDGGAAAIVGGSATDSSVGAGDDGRDGDGGEGDVREDGGREGGDRRGSGEN